MSLFTIGWILWLLWFVVEEGLAFKSDSTPNTLSGHVWFWFAVFDPKAWLRHIVLLAFLVWLTVHLSFGLFG